MLPSGEDMHIRRLPPIRKSMLATGTVKPFGPYQFLKCSGSVHICHIKPTLASKVRSITTESSFAMVALLIVCLLFIELIDIAIQLIKARIPDMAVLLCPLGNFLQGCCVNRAGTILRFLPLCDQPGALQYFDMFGNGRQAHIKRLCQLVHRCFAFC